MERIYDLKKEVENQSNSKYLLDLINRAYLAGVREGNREGYDEGYNEGYDAGYDDGRD